MKFHQVGEKELKQKELDNMQAILPADIMTAKTERDGHAPDTIKKRAFLQAGKINLQ